jgi:hypothetical protein
VNLQHLIDQSTRGLDVSKQQAVVRKGVADGTASSRLSPEGAPRVHKDRNPVSACQDEAMDEIGHSG